MKSYPVTRAQGLWSIQLQKLITYLLHKVCVLCIIGIPLLFVAKSVTVEAQVCEARNNIDNCFGDNQTVSKNVCLSVKVWLDTLKQFRVTELPQSSHEKLPLIGGIEERFRRRRQDTGENKFMCVSYFEWQIHQDTKPLFTTFLEDSRCVYDTLEKMQSVFTINDCKAIYNKSGSGGVLTNEKFCSCDPATQGDNCNVNFTAGFGEPWEAHEMCGSSKLYRMDKNFASNVFSSVTTGTFMLTLMSIYLLAKSYLT